MGEVSAHMPVSAKSTINTRKTHHSENSTKNDREHRTFRTFYRSSQGEDDIQTTLQGNTTFRIFYNTLSLACRGGPPCRRGTFCRMFRISHFTCFYVVCCWSRHVGGHLHCCVFGGRFLFRYSGNTMESNGQGRRRCNLFFCLWA